MLFLSAEQCRFECVRLPRPQLVAYCFQYRVEWQESGAREETHTLQKDEKPRKKSHNLFK